MKRRLFLLLFLALAFGGVASANPITFTFSGSVTQTNFDPNDPFFGAVAFGSLFSGDYTFDPAAPDGNASGSGGSYNAAGAPFGWNLLLGGRNFSNDLLNIGVANNFGTGADQYTVTGGLGTDLVLALFFEDGTGTVFAGDALPLALSLSSFGFNSFVLSGLLDGNQIEIQGSITALQSLGQTPTVVPEPATLSLLAAGLAAFGWRMRRCA